MTDLEEEMSKVKWGGIRLGEKRIYLLQYADVVSRGRGGNKQHARKIRKIFC